ncbi:MAG: M42 family peptidase, partial [Oscillospiraceae bacterium]
MLKKLVSIDGISGYEAPVRNCILQEIKPYINNVNIDTMGNMVATQKNNPNAKNVLLVAHMDESGFIITKITDDGYLKFEIIGSVDLKTLLSKKVIVNGLNGVIALKAIHLTTKAERENPIKSDELFIDIGANNKKEAEKYVDVGDYFTFNSDYVEFGNNFIKSKALASRTGCAILIDILKLELNANITCVFSVQNNINNRGADVVFNNLLADYAIIIDSVECSDTTVEFENTTALNYGPIFSINKVNMTLINKLFEIAKKNNIKYQMAFNKNNLSKINIFQTANNGIQTAKINLPCRYINSDANVINKND